MEWWEKEAAYDSVYRRGKQATDIWKYIPEQKKCGVEDAYSDADGYWIFLTKGWTSYDGDADCRVIHDYNITDLRDSIKTIRREKKHE